MNRKLHSFVLMLVVLSVTLLLPIHSFTSSYRRQSSKHQHAIRMGVTDSVPSPKTSSTVSTKVTAMAFLTTLAVFRSIRTDAMDIDAAMGSFGGNSTSRSIPVAVGVEQPTPPASLTQFMATPGIKQAGPLTHGF